MNVAIIGGGFTGLTAAYRLSKQGHTVVLFEKEPTLGGLAIGFKKKHWDWYLEAAYHHLFTNDDSIISLVYELGLKDQLIIKRPITATLYQNQMYQLDSATSLLSFPGLPFLDRLRTGAFLATMKVNPFWQPLEHLTAKQLALSLGGNSGWKTLWEPLLVGKFGSYADTVAASWFWARIKKRTPSLAYIEGGFQTLVDKLEEKILAQGGKIQKNTEISAKDISRSQFDKIILTIPTPLALKLFPKLKSVNPRFTTPIPHLHAQVLIVETKEPIMKDIYWLNITDNTYPFLALVQHTNYMDKKHYGGNHLAYIGNYLPSHHPYLKLNKNQLFKLFEPFLGKISKSKIHDPKLDLFVAPFAQPVHQKNYSSKAPPIETGINGVLLGNMDSIFPWDRGTNYAVELGETLAKKTAL
jgi:protoporphyrinogen oxidase